ncbi:MAG TPA: glycosyltransferase [Thiotrichales bacterium]|nr:glycosyltransferase [Thiotrichales bacterium]
MPSPLVSIILPFRDPGPLLDACLDSIAAQTLEDFELLCIDDRSGDGSRHRVAARARRDPRIRLLDNPGHGIVSALNHGLSRARGAWIARMDADDHMHPERLARQLRFMRSHPGLDLIGSRVRIVPAHRRNAGLAEYERWINGCTSPRQIADDRYVECPLPHPTWFTHRRFFERHGPYAQGPFPEDYELLLRALSRGARLGKHPQVLLEWRDSDARASRTDPRCMRSAFDRLRQSFLARDRRLHSGRPLAFWGAGRTTRKRMNALAGHGIAPDLWIDIDPRKIGNRIAGVPVESPEALVRPVRPFVLVLVASHGARARISDWLESHGFRRGDDYLHVG